MGWRIDDLAHEAEITVDTIRFYQREGLLPPAERVGRTKEYGPDHLDRIKQIRDLQQRRFSLAAIKALLNSDRQDLVDGIFAGEGGLSYSYADLIERSALESSTVDRLRDRGLLRDPAEFGRAAYDSTDLDVLRAASELQKISVPEDVLVELAAIYVDGVEAMQREVLELFSGARGRTWEPGELAAFQQSVAASATQLLPLVTRIVEYVHQRTLQRLTLGAIERGAFDPPTSDAPTPDAPHP